FQYLAAAHVKRVSVTIAAVMARGQTILDQADTAFVHAHLAAGDAGLGEADEARFALAAHAQDERAAMHPCEPIPILAGPAVAIGGGIGREPERGAAVGSEREQLALARFLPKQGERQLVARIDERNARFALAAAIGD